MFILLCKYVFASFISICGLIWLFIRMSNAQRQAQRLQMPGLEIKECSPGCAVCEHRNQGNIRQAVQAAEAQEAARRLE